MSLARLSTWYLESKTINGKVNACSPTLVRRKQTVESAFFVVLRQVYPWGNATLRENVWKFTYSEGVGRNHFGKRRGQGGEQSSNCHLSGSLSLFLSRTLPFFFLLSPSLCLAMAWFHAKRCFHGAVISFSQRTYNPLSFLLTLRVLSSDRPLSCHFSPSRAHARVSLLSSCLPLESSKRAVSFTSSSSFDCVLSTPETHRFTGDIVRDTLFRINQLWLSSRFYWNLSINPEFNSRE